MQAREAIAPETDILTDPDDRLELTADTLRLL